MTVEKAEKMTGLMIRVTVKKGPRGGRRYEAVANHSNCYFMGTGSSESQALSALLRVWRTMPARAGR